MKIETTTMTPELMMPSVSRASSDGLFDALLHRADRAEQSGRGHEGAQSQGTGVSDRARQAAVDLVAITFVEPILRQARETRSSEPPFGQTQAERQFGSLMDAQTARRIVQSWEMPLVKRIADDIASRSGSAGDVGV